MTATGARSFTMLGLEQQIPGQNCGGPIPLITPIAAPAAPTSVAGVSTGITATVAYKRSLIIKGRGETLPSTASTDLVLTNEDAHVQAAAPVATNVLGQAIYRTTDAGADGWPRVHIQWNDDAIDFLDSTAPGAEEKVFPKAADQTAANAGLVQFPMDPGKIIERVDGETTPNELTGELGMPRALPMQITVPFEGSCSARAGALALHYATTFGKPTVTYVTDEPVAIYDFPLSDLAEDSVSGWGVHHPGDGFNPLLAFGLKWNEYDYKSAMNSELGVTLKGKGTSESECAWGKVKVKTGTYPYAPTVRGARGDANRYSDSIFLKKISASAGVMIFRASLAAAGTSSPTFGSSSTNILVYYDTTTGAMLRPPDSDEDEPFVEIIDQNGNPVGFDDAEHREPVSVWFPGDLRLMADADEFEILALALVPGIRTGSFTQQARRIIGLERFTPAHITFKNGSKRISFQALGVKIARTATEKWSHGPTARRPQDVDITGYATVELSFEKRYVTREFERFMKENARFEAQVNFVGARIPINSTTKSTYRESMLHTFPQSRVSKNEAPSSGPGITMQKTTIAVEQPDDGSQAVQARIITAMTYPFYLLAPAA